MKHVLHAIICIALLHGLRSCQGILSSGDSTSGQTQQTDNTSLRGDQAVDPDASEPIDEEGLNDNSQQIVSQVQHDKDQESEFPDNTSTDPQPKPLRIVEGKFFAFGLADGWKVTEDGQFAVVTVAPDNNAITVMVGNAGMPVNYSAGQYVYERLASAGFQQIQMGQGRQAKPIPGCNTAYEFDFRYVVNGAPCLGSARCHIATSYDFCTMIMTAAASVEKQWNGYRHWLPEVAALGQALNGAAFGARGIMEQNLRNSAAYAEAARNYREWSQKNWESVTADRNRSVDERNRQFRENIGGVQTYTNPYDPGRPMEMSNQYKYYWINSKGQTIGTNDPSENPNTGSTQEWKRMMKQ
jgi:hypothetical protein